MANSGAALSSDAAQASGDEYQVFLSFRGSDTRHGFTDFLYHGLMDAGVRVFKDDDEYRVGEVIGENLLHIMNNAILYIPIFSRTYAFSIRCLQELAFMVDHVSKSEDRKSILPIFLDVEPEDVKLMTPLYRAAFEKHKEDFPNEVEAWRKALAEVDEIKGWNVEKDQSQATIVKLAVEKVLEKLEIKQKSVVKHLVGLDDRVKHLLELLDVDHQDVRFIGIYGKGGIGKTTVAKVIFDKLSSQFEKCCSFLENVRESLLTKEGIVQLQRKLLSDIVGSGSAEQLMDNEQAMRRIGETLSAKKVLVVLDDVDKKEHINKIIGGYSLHSRSRIIITTRNKIVLNAKGLKAEILCYEMLKMDDALALQLFCQHALNGEFPSDIYHGLSSKIVSIIGGLPLAIEVIGSLLNGKDEAFWKETLVRLRKVPDEDIMEMLRISYDNLDRYQQQIFLDVACFMFNENKTEAIYMWADCQFYPIRGLKVLTDRCLIKISDNDKIWMHDQLVDLGRHIVRQESPFNPGKRSRLWTVQEALEAMRTKKRKDDIQALKIYGSGDSIEITDEKFERLQNLRLLELNWGTYAGDFARCHSNLRWFSWHSPQDFRADNMYLEHLVVCKLDTIDFKDDSKAWDLIKRAQNLKALSITRCSSITRIPNFSKCSRLERLTLANCFNLEKIESFIGDLGSLIELKIELCQGLRDLPEELGALVKLKHLSFSGCRGLRELPGSLRSLTSLKKLNLWGTSIAKFPGMPLLRHAQEIPPDTSNVESKLDKTKTEGGDKATSRWQVVRRWMTSKGSYNKEKKKGKVDGNTNPQPSYFIRKRKGSGDGYTWRKYGGKHVKGSKTTHSYYHCTFPGCPTRKKVERSLDGHITEIEYKGTHNHPEPLAPRTLSTQSLEPPSSCITYLENPDRLALVMRSENAQQDSAESSSASMGDEDSEGKSQMSDSAGDGDGSEPEAKRLRGENVHETHSASGGMTVREPRVVVQTISSVDILDDGYSWRKYGQRMAKGNPCPRSYYRCSYPGCPVRKQVQRSSDDKQAVITTYQGKHNHDVLPVRARDISPKNASSEEKKNVTFTEEIHGEAKRQSLVKG